VGKGILHNSAKFRHVNSHVEGRQCLEPYERAASEFLRGILPTDESLEIGCGELNEGLEEVPLLGPVPRHMPEVFEDLVRLPPVGEIEEVNPIEVRCGLVPVIWVEG
jgi:hypothetical protein